MDEATANLIQTILSAAQFAVVLAGVCWAIYRFRVEAPLNPRIELDVRAAFNGPQNGYYVTQILVSATNKGLRVRKFPSLKLLVRGISKHSDIQEWPEHEPRLLFPEKLIDHAEVIFRENYGHIFVEPGVNQNVSYNCRIPDHIRFVTVRAEFKYDEKRTHSAERLFDTENSSVAMQR